MPLRVPVLVKCYARTPPLNALGAVEARNDAVFLLTTIPLEYPVYISIPERVSKSLETIAPTGIEVFLAAKAASIAELQGVDASANANPRASCAPGKRSHLFLCDTECRQSTIKAALSCCIIRNVSVHCKPAESTAGDTGHYFDDTTNLTFVFFSSGINAEIPDTIPTVRFRSAFAACVYQISGSSLQRFGASFKVYLHWVKNILVRRRRVYTLAPFLPGPTERSENERQLGTPNAPS
ncbi:hypothetical protein C8R46DRAFT_29362 [Mycena filopes]|nr:hypothetical protein C8R46DRAFT_29362 [Mycena filopes]